LLPASCFVEFAAGVPSAFIAGRRSLGGRGTYRCVERDPLSFASRAEFPGCATSWFVFSALFFPERSRLITRESRSGGLGTERAPSFIGRLLSALTDLPELSGRPASALVGLPISAFPGRPWPLPIGRPRSALFGCAPSDDAPGIPLFTFDAGGASFLILAIVSESTAIP